MRADHRCLGLLAGLVVPAAACAESLNEDLPVAPDMSALVAAYEHPTGRLDPATAPLVAARLAPVLDIAAALPGLSEGVSDLLGSTLDDDVSADAPRTGPVARDGEIGPGAGPGEDDLPLGLDLSGEGFIRVFSVCQGWEGASAPDQARNGAIGLTAVYSSGEVEPVIWGGFERCLTRIDERDVYVDGGVTLSLGRPLPAAEALETIADAPKLVRLAGTLEIDGERWLDEDLDFRYCPDHATGCEGGTLEVSLSLGDAGNVVFFTRDHQLGGFRTADVTWACTLTTGVCASEAGTTIELGGVK